jgi:hypothetical protein
MLTKEKPAKKSKDARLCKMPAAQGIYDVDLMLGRGKTFGGSWRSRSLRD